MLPPNFWLPPPLNIVFVVLSICVIGSYFLAYTNYKKARKYKRELDYIKSKYHSEDTILNKPQISPKDNKTTNRIAKECDNLANKKGYRP